MSVAAAGGSSLLSQHVGGVYYINLDRRRNRRDAIEEQFGRSPLLRALGRPRRVVGIDGRTLPLQELVENGTLTSRALERDMDGTNGQTTLGDERLTRGAAGLALTYLQLWQHIANERLPVLVFEDDAQLHPQFDARLAELLARYANTDLWREAHLLYLGGDAVPPSPPAPPYDAMNFRSDAWMEDPGVASWVPGAAEDATTPPFEAADPEPAPWMMSETSPPPALPPRPSDSPSTPQPPPPPRPEPSPPPPPLTISPSPPPIPSRLQHPALVAPPPWPLPPPPVPAPRLAPPSVAQSPPPSPSPPRDVLLPSSRSVESLPGTYGEIPTDMAEQLGQLAMEANGAAPGLLQQQQQQQQQQPSAAAVAVAAAPESPTEQAAVPLASEMEGAAEEPMVAAGFRAAEERIAAEQAGAFLRQRADFLRRDGWRQRAPHRATEEPPGFRAAGDAGAPAPQPMALLEVAASREPPEPPDVPPGVGDVQEQRGGYDAVWHQQDMSYAELGARATEQTVRQLMAEAAAAAAATHSDAVAGSPPPPPPPPPPLPLTPSPPPPPPPPPPQLTPSSLPRPPPPPLPPLPKTVDMQAVGEGQPINWVHQTIAYLLFPAGAQLLVDTILPPLDRQIDSELVRLQRDGTLRAYWMEPPLLQPQAFGAESDVQQKLLLNLLQHGGGGAVNASATSAPPPRLVAHKRFNAARRDSQPVRLVPAFDSKPRRKRQLSQRTRQTLAREPALAAALFAMRGEARTASNVLSPVT